MAVELAYSEKGSGRPLVILHGLFGSKRNWSSLAGTLAARFRVLAVDLRNHGESPWDSRHDYAALADDVAELIGRHVGGPAAVIGHSMGGKAAMTLALHRPDLVERLVVVDIAPAPSGEHTLDVLRTLVALPLAGVTRRSEAEAMLAASGIAPGVAAFLAQNLATGPEGHLAWMINLDALDRHAEDILGFPEPPPGSRFDGPTCFIAGGRSDYLRPEHLPLIERLFPAAEILTIESAGHWVHAEKPTLFLEAVARFLEGRSLAGPDPGA